MHRHSWPRSRERHSASFDLGRSNSGREAEKSSTHLFCLAAFASLTFVLKDLLAGYSRYGRPRCSMTLGENGRKCVKTEGGWTSVKDTLYGCVGLHTMMSVSVRLM